MTDVEQHLAKIAISQPHRAHARTRLFELLDTARQQRIVWIAAPPGAGDGLCKNVASNDVSFRRNLSLKEGVLHEDETI